jgi:hypothetical protein
MNFVSAFVYLIYKILLLSTCTHYNLLSTYILVVQMNWCLFDSTLNLCFSAH